MCAPHFRDDDDWEEYVFYGPEPEEQYVSEPDTDELLDGLEERVMDAMTRQAEEWDRAGLLDDPAKVRAATLPVDMAIAAMAGLKPGRVL
jgi:hypothetical protein